MKPPNELRFDVVLVGGGLQNGLIALALTAARPELRIAIVERAGRLGGEHTWCFHEDDIPGAARAWLAPLVEFTWDGYEVAFPGFERRVASAYRGVSAQRFRQVVGALLPAHAILLDAEAARIERSRVVLRDGRELTARLVVDARGPEVEAARGGAGFQKFVGRELALSRPHGLLRPIVMDANVPQQDGFRFAYVLPLAPDRVLVEDTYFSDQPDLDRAAVGAEVDAYARARGWHTARVVREEHGVLPMAWARPRPRAPGAPIRGGYRGGFVHPATGYSLPIATRVAVQLASVPLEHAEAALAALTRELAPQMRFARLLNRLLFRWYAPAHRTEVFARFYRMPDDLIGRFYALRTTRRDRLRLLLGKPPRGFSFRARLAAVGRCADARRV